MSTGTLLDAEKIDAVLRTLNVDRIQNLQKLSDRKRTEEEQRRYAERAEQALPILKEELEAQLRNILEEVARQVGSLEQLIFWRGGISIIDQVLERFEWLAAQSRQSKVRDEPPSPHQVIPTLTEGGEL